MRPSVTRAVIAAVVCTAPAFAQAPPPRPQHRRRPPPAGALFEAGPFYAGPRVWIGNLNGAVAIGGQIERGFTQPGAYGPGIIAGGVGIDHYSWDFDYALAAGTSTR